MKFCPRIHLNFVCFVRYLFAHLYEKKNKQVHLLFQEWWKNGTRLQSNWRFRPSSSVSFTRGCLINFEQCLVFKTAFVATSKCSTVHSFIHLKPWKSSSVENSLNYQISYNYDCGKCCLTVQNKKIYMFLFKILLM